MSTITTRERFVAKLNNPTHIWDLQARNVFRLNEDTLVVCGNFSTLYDPPRVRIYPLVWYLKNEAKLRNGKLLEIDRLSLLGDSLTVVKNKKPLYLLENGKDGKATIKIANEEGIFPESEEVSAKAKGGSTGRWTTLDTGSYARTYRR